MRTIRSRISGQVSGRTCGTGTSSIARLPCSMSTNSVVLASRRAQQRRLADAIRADDQDARAARLGEPFFRRDDRNHVNPRVSERETAPPTERRRETNLFVVAKWQLQRMSAPLMPHAPRGRYPFRQDWDCACESGDNELIAGWCIEVGCVLEFLRLFAYVRHRRSPFILAVDGAFTVQAAAQARVRAVAFSEALRLLFFVLADGRRGLAAARPC